VESVTEKSIAMTSTRKINQTYIPQHTAAPQAPAPVKLQAVAGLLQPRLTIGPVDDPYEREAERVADQVMRMPLCLTSSVHQPRSSAVPSVRASRSRRCAQAARPGRSLQPSRQIGKLLFGPSCQQLSSNDNSYVLITS
jgi:hypothetical protein